MRFLFLSALVGGVLALGGCATPLNVEKNGGSAAAIVGVAQSEIKFIGYCGFGDVPPGANHIESNGGQGLIVLTDDSVVLMAGELPNASVRLYAHRCASVTAVGVRASPTPIMASRVTNVASSVSDQPSVPDGRSGSTR